MLDTDAAKNITLLSENNILLTEISITCLKDQNRYLVDYASIKTHKTVFVFIKEDWK